MQPTRVPERRIQMPGERFSTVYLRSQDPTPDSSRARHRVSTLFREVVVKSHNEQLARYIGQELGIVVPRNGSHSSDWTQFLRECRTPDFLDAITLVYRYLFYHASEDLANQWRDVVKKIFAEENLAYNIDQVCGVHPAVDREFQTNNASTIAGLAADRYEAVRDSFKQAVNHLNGVEPNYLQAWRGTFAAVEALFVLMFPYARLTADDVERRLRPLVEGTYASDEAAQKAAHRMVDSV